MKNDANVETAWECPSRPPWQIPYSDRQWDDGYPDPAWKRPDRGE